MKICSNNQQAEFFIALESAELIISEIFLRIYKTVTKLSRHQKITFWCWTYTSKFLTSVSSWHAGNKCSMNFISLCMYVAWYHVSKIFIFIFEDESVLDVHNEYFTRVRPTSPNVRPTPTNTAGRRHEVAAPWSTALRSSAYLHCIHASAIKCWLFSFFTTTMPYICDFWLNYRGRLGYTYQTSAESVYFFFKWRASRSQASRHDRLPARSIVTAFNGDWAAELVSHAHRTQVFLFVQWANKRANKCSLRNQKMEHNFLQTAMTKQKVSRN